MKRFADYMNTNFTPTANIHVHVITHHDLIGLKARGAIVVNPDPDLTRPTAMINERHYNHHIFRALSGVINVGGIGAEW